MSSPIEVTFEYEERDFAAFYRWAWLRAMRLPALILATLVGAYVVVFLRERPPGELMRQPVIVFAVTMFALLVVMSVIVRPRFYAKQSMRTHQGPTTYRFDADAMSLESPQVRAKVRWDDMHRARESPTALLLYPSKVEAHVLPKRAMTDAEVESVRALLRANRLLR